MVTYIKKNVPETYVVLEQELNPALYNDLGSTYEDYLNNKWVKLSDAQLKFKQLYPNASVKEVFEMTLEFIEVSASEELENAKIEVLRKIDAYNTSPSVDSFILNSSIRAWFTVQERLNYKQSVEAAKLLGETTLDFYIGDMKLTISSNAAEVMLAQIQLYADKCFIVTKQHKLAVQSLETVEDVYSYDYTKGYPQRLNFKLT